MSLLFSRPPAAAARGMTEEQAFSGASVVPLAGGNVRALRLASVWSAVTLIADSVASFPLQAFRRNGDGTRTPIDYAWPVPATQTTFTWVHQAMVSMLLRGNAFGYAIATDPKSGWPSLVEWLPPQQITRAGKVWALNGRQLDPAAVLHVPAFLLPGEAVGLSPITQFATTIDAGLHADRAVSEWYASGTVPGQHLKNSARTLTPAEAAVMKARFKATMTTGEPFVTGADWTLDQVGVSAADAQFLDAIRANATQIAAIFRVPPEKIGGETGSSMTYATTEQQGIDFLTYALRPWMVRFEQALSTIMPRDLNARFNPDALLRTDVKTRMDAYQVALAIGALTQDEVRALEDRQPLDEKQQAQWSATFSNGGKKRGLDLVEAVQKIYLGVDKVITAEEARQILNAYGADLTGPGPQSHTTGATNG